MEKRTARRTTTFLRPERGTFAPPVDELEVSSTRSGVSSLLLLDKNYVTPLLPCSGSDLVHPFFCTIKYVDFDYHLLLGTHLWVPLVGNEPVPGRRRRVLVGTGRVGCRRHRLHLYRFPLLGGNDHHHSECTHEPGPQNTRQYPAGISCCASYGRHSRSTNALCPYPQGNVSFSSVHWPANKVQSILRMSWCATLASNGLRGWCFTAAENG